MTTANRAPAPALVRSRWIAPVLTVLLSSLAAAQALQVWRWRPGTPLGLGGDSTQIAMEVRDLLEHGWYWSNPSLGFPYGQAGYLFPDPSLGNGLAVKAIALFSHDPFTVAAIWFLVGFPLAGLAMHLLMRWAGLGRVAAVVGGTLFAVAPGHQTMSRHLWLSSYWVLPIGLWLVLAVARGDRLWSRDPVGPVVRGRRLPLWAVTLAALVVLGLGHIYYVGFSLILLAVVLLVRLLGSKRLVDVVPGAAAAALVGVVAVLPLLATKVAARGITVTGELPAARTPGQSEVYAGKLMDLVLPWYGHRVPGLGYLTWAYNLSANRTVERPALGIIALVGVGALVVVTLRALLSGRREDPWLLRLAGLAGVTAAFYTVGGLASFVALFFTAQLRTWSRLWIVLFALGLLAVGHWLTGRARRSRALGLALGVLVLTVGVLDQTSPAQAPDYAKLRSQRADIAAYVDQLAGGTKAGCPVFQLPVLPFPEASPRGDMQGYDQQLPYAVAGSVLRWSGGAMHGTREADWQRAVDSTRPDEMAADLAAVGFCAVEVDTDGYRNADAAAPRLEPALGAPVAQTSDGRFVAYRLPAAAADATRRAAVLAPVLVDLGAYVPTTDARGVVSQWLAPRGSVTLVNLGTEAVQGIRISFEVTSARGVGRTFELRDGDRVLAKGDLSDRPQSVTVTVDAPPGVTTLPFTVSGDPDIDSEPGQARSASATGLVATAGDPDVRISTGQEQAAR